MKTEYLYVIVDSSLSCWRMAERKTEKTTLSEVLAEGWRPVRETPYGPGASGEAYILICLEREPSGNMGFGFGP